jgi:hypothetical protein
LSEIRSGSNPHYHTNTDNYIVYSEKDFQFGFSAVQMTVASLCRLAGVFDSATTGAITDHPVKTGARPATAATKARIFDISGRLITEVKEPFDRRMLSGNNGSLRILPRGVYVIRLINDQYPAETKHLKLLTE